MSSDNDKKMKKIMIMEDEPILLKALSIELSSDGYEILSADNGETGLDLMKKVMPDLLLLDLLMPVKNGFQVLEELKANGVLSKLPVIVLSNLGQDSDKKRAMDLGAKDFFIKSATDLGELNQLIEKIIS